ncbi:hypothetical protein JZ751_020150 [Albula glossodonta]|uniref:Uncharacterized protein n=1 Tax=Albula glossodonta TaxID=121402 RepID=A0A8T2NX24_9TELE|nr:hypothetical protein JZ751_020150 [Albula glossodonta]
MPRLCLPNGCCLAPFLALGDLKGPGRAGSEDQGSEGLVLPESEGSGDHGGEGGQDQYLDTQVQCSFLAVIG